MLILSRKKQESFVISDNIEITVLEVQGDKVRIGITAPKDIPVLRKEIIETTELNKEASAKSSEQDLDVLKQYLNAQK